MHKQQCGFTLIELIVTVGIIAIVVSLSAVSFNSWNSEATSRAALAKIRSALVVTRMEAIKRGSWMMLCSSSTGESCNASFNDGWILFHDVNANSELDAEESILITEEIDSSVLSFTVTDSAGNELEQIGFNFRGIPTQNTVVAASRGGFSGQFAVSRLGRISAH